jgi:tetratricopeptide (TPR) repeat protein
MQRLFLKNNFVFALAVRAKSHTKNPMSRLRGRSQNRENQESCPGDPGAAFLRRHFGAAKARPRLIALLLALITLLAYWPVLRDSFINYDDQVYVTDNHVVQNGLTWAGVQWAFTAGHASNWHPVTWLSHMMDCELFGLNAGAQHYVNVLFHAANTVLLLLLLFRLTGALWPSAFVAALFAWHPLHVESVAWISERKDVLSTFFALLTLLAYVKAVTSDRCQVARTNPALSRFTVHVSRFYWLALFFFALGLMAKPMLVTLPFVMLLLDCWPLERFKVQGSGFRVQGLILEKWPFFLLVLISCIVTFLVQRHGEAVMTIQQFPLHLRVANALIAYERYLGKAFWPSNLAILYPLPNHLSWMRAMAATAIGLLAGISWLIWRMRRQCPYLLIGWLWFLGMLVPVIGLVQVGSAGMADRYTYFPLVGVFIAVAFGVRDLANRFQFPKAAVAAAAALTLALCLILTENQLRYWYDSESLFAHTLAATGGENPNAQINYGAALEQKGRLAEALVQYREVERMAPDNIEARYNIGNLLDKMGRPEEALPELRQAVQINPKSPAFHDTLGAVLVELGRFDEAMNQLAEAARLDPAYPAAHFDMGKLLLKQGRDSGAIDEFRAALRLDPDNFQILAYTAHVLAAHENPQIRDGKTALMLAATANALTGGAQPFVLDALGMACAETGDFTNALEVTQRAMDLATAAKMSKLEPLQQRLQLYKNHQPWRESFLATNTPAKH